jgi:hypothetical protein
MPAEKQDFELWIGNTKKLRIAVKDQSGIPVPVNRPGTKIFWKLQRKPNSTTETDIYIRKNNQTPDGGIGPGQADHEFLVAILPEDSLKLRPGDYYHQADVVDPEGNTSTVTTGTPHLKGGPR